MSRWHILTVHITEWFYWWIA